MTIYKVIEAFADLQDNGHVYHAGDEFPRQGVLVKPSRYEELASNKNRLGKVLIEKVPEIMPEPVETPAGEGRAETAKKPSRKRASKK